MNTAFTYDKQGQLNDPNLTDGTFVVEAPSFIVPYVYEKPPKETFQQFKDSVKKLTGEGKDDEKAADLAKTVKDGEKDKNEDKDKLTEKPVTPSDEKVLQGFISYMPFSPMKLADQLSLQCFYILLSLEY